MRYCCRCVIPDTRPAVKMSSDGVCSACLGHKKKTDQIDWAQREFEFESLVSSVKDSSANYDCLIPVSGGKDSTWQVIQCLKWGLHPLTISWKPPYRTTIGTKNLENLKSLGVDHIDFTINPEVEKKFLKQALTRYGSTAIPMHMAMFNIPPNMAIKLGIPLVVWGENSAEEYAGETGGHILDFEWFTKFGVTHGTTAADWVSDQLSEQELTPYFGPTEEELFEHQVRGIFLGHYFNWDPERSLETAKENGFLPRSEGPKTGFYNYADIDDEFISIHHYLKWHKFGFTRSYDNLSLEIRNGRMARSEAIEWLSQRGDETPIEDIEKFCEFVGISQGDFYEIIERFRNREIWYEEKGVWKIKDFLIPEWCWS